MSASPARQCRRKHWPAWTTKTLGDGSRIVICPICGNEPEQATDSRDGGR